MRISATALHARWRTWHNLLLVLLCLGSVWLMIESFNQTGIPALHRPETFRNLFLIGGISIGFDMLPMLLYLSQRRFEQGVSHQPDRRDTQVMTGMMMVGVILWSFLWIGVLKLNQHPPVAEAQTWTVSRRGNSPKNKAVIELALKSDDLSMDLEIASRTLNLPPEAIAIGDTMIIAQEHGRLGLNWISSLTWQPAGKKEQAKKLWPLEP